MHQILAVRHRLDPFDVRLFQSGLNFHQPHGDGIKRVVVVFALRQLFRQLFQRDGAFAFQRLRGGLVRFRHADGVNQEKVRFRPRVWRDRLQIRVGHGTHAASFHLFVIQFRMHVAHENQNFQRFDVRSRRDHVHRDRDAQSRRCPKFVDQIRRLFTRHVVSDLFAKRVVFAEHFAGDADDFLGMVVVLGENQRFRHPSRIAVRKQLRPQSILVALNDRANLVRRHNGTVKLVRSVCDIVVNLPVRFPARFLIPLQNGKVMRDYTALFRDFRADSQNLVIDVHAVDDRSFIRIFGDDVLVKVAQRHF